MGGANIGNWSVLAAFGLLLAVLPAFADEAASEPSPGRLRPLGLKAIVAAPPVASQHLSRVEVGFGVSIVELAPQGAQLGPQRHHHALSFASERPKALLRSFGLDATDCSTQVRFPGRLRQSSQGITAEVQGQVQFGCRF